MPRYIFGSLGACKPSPPPRNVPGTLCAGTVSGSPRSVFRHFGLRNFVSLRDSKIYLSTRSFSSRSDRSKIYLRKGATQRYISGVSQGIQKYTLALVPSVPDLAAQKYTSGRGQHRGIFLVCPKGSKNIPWHSFLHWLNGN